MPTQPKPNDPNNPYRIGQKNDKGETICGSKTRSAKPCTQTRLGDNGRCRMHNGNAAKGVAAPNFKTGRWSKYVEPELAERYHASLEDSELLSLEDEIALTDALIASALPRLKTRESGAAWGLLRKSIDKLEESFVNEDYGKVTILMRQMRDVIDERVEHFAAEAELRTNMEQRRKLSESRRKHLIEMEQMITVEQANLFAGAILDIIRRNVTDKYVLSAIQTEFVSILNRKASERINAGSEDTE